MIVSGSTLYGMTESGGTHQDGTAFSLAVGGGTPTTLFNFDGTHGQYPIGDLMLSGSTLYGMAWQGGINGDGTVFSLPAGGGTPTTLYSFDGTYGASPQGSLILSGSTLYGMTVGGGANGDGNVFSIPVGGGTPTNLYSFDGPHGENPCGSLTLSADGSTLYGTTGWGGNMSLNNGFGDGNVFSLPVGGGTPTTLFNCGGILGEHPLGSLTLSADGSTLYGMTRRAAPTATARFLASPWAAALRPRCCRLTAPTVCGPAAV